MHLLGQDGVWYRTEYAGEGAIGLDDVVDVVILESLPDGTVVSDMEASGKVISPQLSAYPPLLSGRRWPP
ncbi:hypothetical protein QRZ34_28895 [Klebsiella michiganensis]|uniref:hypothetical protein n=1 Tax=Klebsiella michiganensis TaxID=1134687 RepID=UPI00256FC32F|nr:hypothetical protein [Klebsiella michiganensis]MDL4455005.1 hypothetical protein [Klebsiella michiganensis]